MQQMTAAVGEGSETMQGSASERENIFCSAATHTSVWEKCSKSMLIVNDGFANCILRRLMHTRQVSFMQLYVEMAINN